MKSHISPVTRFILFYLFILLTGCLNEKEKELEGIPGVSVSSKSFSAITSNSFTITANVIKEIENITEIGFCYSDDDDEPTIKNKTVVGEFITDTEFSAVCSELRGNTTYFVKAYAKYAGGVAYSKTIHTTTLEESIYTVTTSIYTPSTTSVELSGRIRIHGIDIEEDENIKEVGFVYSTKANPTIKDKVLVSRLFPGAFFYYNLNALEEDTQYYVKAYMKDENDNVVYGDEVSFRTLGASMSFHLSQPGSLRSVLQENEGMNVVKLALTGTLNILDLQTLNGLTYLSELDLEKASVLGNRIESNLFKNTHISVFKLPENLETIATNAFENSYRLTEMTFPKNMKSIESAAFNNSGLTSITFTNDLNVAGSAFASCNNLSTINFHDSMKKIESSTFRNCTNLASIKLPAQLESIGSYAFSGCKNLSGITFYSNLKAIHNNAFESCINLQNVTLPNGLQTLGKEAFSNCQTLTSISFPETLTTIGENCFFACLSLLSIKLPENLENLGSYAFCYCKILHTVILPKKIEYMGSHIFSECASLETITIPNTWTSIPEAFFKNSSLKRINLSNGLTRIHSEAFNNCSKLTAITVPSGVEKIGNYAFSGCTALSSVTLSEGLTTIGSYAFKNCLAITNIKFPVSLTNIESYAFTYCTGITAITIPQNITSIGNYAFGSCTNLKDIYATPVKPPTIQSQTFDSTVNIHIPGNYYSTYKNAYYWRSHNLIEMD